MSFIPHPRSTLWLPFLHSDFDKDDVRRHIPRFEGENFAKNLEMVKVMEGTAKKKGCTAAQLGLAYILELSPTVSVLKYSDGPEQSG